MIKPMYAIGGGYIIDDGDFIRYPYYAAAANGDCLNSPAKPPVLNSAEFDRVFGGYIHPKFAADRPE